MLPRVFFHVAEFNEAGYQAIPALAFLGAPLVLWSPSGRQIDDAKDSGFSILGSDDLLALVRKGFVRVSGRREWLTSELHREAKAKEVRRPHAKWSDFDDGIREIAMEDRATQGEPRVVFAARDEGGDWADDQMEKRTEGRRRFGT
jgi:hypothetical protein